MSGFETTPANSLDAPTPEQLVRYAALLRTIAEESGRVRLAKVDDLIPIVPGTIALGVAPKFILTPEERLVLSGNSEYMIPAELDEWISTGDQIELGRYRRYIASLKSIGGKSLKLSLIESDYQLRDSVAYEGQRSTFTFSWNEDLGTFETRVCVVNSVSATIEGVAIVEKMTEDGKKYKEMVIDKNEPIPRPPDPNVHVPQLATTTVGDVAGVVTITKESFELLEERTKDFGSALKAKLDREALELNKSYYYNK